MANISRNSVKKLLKEQFKVSITDGGAEEIACMLEGEAKRISSFAVKNARKNRRDKVTKEDIVDYVIKERD